MKLRTGTAVVAGLHSSVVSGGRVTKEWCQCCVRVMAGLCKGGGGGGGVTVSDVVIFHHHETTTCFSSLNVILLQRSLPLTTTHHFTFTLPSLPLSLYINPFSCVFSLVPPTPFPLSSIYPPSHTEKQGVMVYVHRKGRSVSWQRLFGGIMSP